MNSLSDKLLTLHTDNPLSLKQLIDSMGEQSFGIILLFLSLPSAMPIPAPGFSTPFGIMCILIAMQLLLRRKTPYLPEKVLHKEFQAKTGKLMLAFMIKNLRLIERFIKPRLSLFLNQQLIATLILILAIIMALPIPLTNSAPALNILIFSIAMIENDGLLALLASIMALVLITVYFVSFYIIVVYGLSTLVSVKDHISNLFNN